MLVFDAIRQIFDTQAVSGGSDVDDPTYTLDDQVGEEITYQWSHDNRTLGLIVCDRKASDWSM